jgi:NADP-dependent 3-hydroxy acid dehydrogenase YdfG
MAERVNNYGAETYALSNNAERLKTLKEAHPKIQTICADLADWNATSKEIQKLDPIHCLVNNAGKLVLPTAKVTV